MKKLLIIRHAKSDWDNMELSDFDRPLNHRGEKNAPEMAQRLLKKHIIPQHLVSSPALRAISTARYFADILGINPEEIQQEKAIYEASFTILLNLINTFDNRFDFIALFGHNPAVTNLVYHLSGKQVYNMPTCSMALIEFPFDEWEYISGNTGDLLWFDFPKSNG
ncbi:histidine phosphatase family protein [Pedobacter sp. BS3]|uniref:SixA phosphatase family protein n=1 Tax=Pedobacter sp. BS3 TaxID=2567937 RepID=UPI0011EBA549|nr:histidine phosphatase family protein [Pedobacter sp. BS3]TZF82687.1 histidine phosphatase family protein [Pedobacter sp. BS3]